MLKVHGSLEQDTPVWVDQLENCQPELGEAVTVTDEPTINEPPLALTDPWPPSTPIAKGSWATFVVVNVVTIDAAALHPAVRVPVPPTCNPVPMLVADIARRPPVVDQEENMKPGLGLKAIAYVPRSTLMLCPL